MYTYKNVQDPPVMSSLTLFLLSLIGHMICTVHSSLVFPFPLYIFV